MGYSEIVVAVAAVSTAIILNSPYLEEGWQGRESFGWYHVDEAQAGLIEGGIYWLLGLAVLALIVFLAQEIDWEEEAATSDGA